jgi:hypothetical protein
MTISYRLGEVDAYGATVRAQAMVPEAEHRAIVRDGLIRDATN